MTSHRRPPHDALALRSRQLAASPPSPATAPCTAPSTGCTCYEQQLQRWHRELARHPRASLRRSRPRRMVHRALHRPRPHQRAHRPRGQRPRRDTARPSPSVPNTDPRNSNARHPALRAPRHRLPRRHRLHAARRRTASSSAPAPPTTAPASPRCSPSPPRCATPRANQAHSTVHHPLRRQRRRRRRRRPPRHAPHLLSASPYAERIRAAIALEGCGAATVVDRALGSAPSPRRDHRPRRPLLGRRRSPQPHHRARRRAHRAHRSSPSPPTPRTTLNCGTISGGTSVNSIPSSATADLDLRSISPEELESLEIARPLHALEVRQGRGPPRPRAATRSRNSRPVSRSPRIYKSAASATAPPALSPPDSALALSLRAVDRHLNLRTESRIGSTDANLPLSLGIPALAIGAGGTGGGIHTLDEWYDPTGRELALRRILLLLLDTCATHRGVDHLSAPYPRQRANRTQTRHREDHDIPGQSPAAP